MKNKIYLLLAVSLAAKIILLLIYGSFSVMNPDEEYNFQHAQYLFNGSGSGQQNYPAFHGYAPVYVYKTLLTLGIKKKAWVILVHLFTLAAFAFSILAFYKLALLFITEEKSALYTAAVYCFYPSVLIYIGPLFSYENMAMPLLVIVVYRLASALRYNFSKTDYLLIPAGVCISCLFRGQMIFVYAVVLSAFFILSLAKKKYNGIPMIFFTVTFVFIFHLPILLKYKSTFNAYILSTQPGFEFLQGHNPTARGSWMGEWQDSSNVLYKYSHQQIKNISSMNEYEESEARKKLALTWIKQNPLSELKLAVKKLAIYFLPRNYEASRTYAWFNPLNFAVHLLFLFAIGKKIFKRKFSADDFLIFSPVAASLLLTLIFFAGYRWRYYAEPFMIIFAAQFIFIFLLKKRREEAGPKSAP